MENYSLSEKPKFYAGQIVKAVIHSAHIKTYFDCEILGIASIDLIDRWIVRDIKKVIAPSETYPFEVFTLSHTSFVKEIT